MKIYCTVFLLFVISIIPVSAQDISAANSVVGVWHLNYEASEFVGEAPQLEVRRYSDAGNGFLRGLAISIDAQGNPNFLQFTAKSDGNDYPEYQSSTLSQLQAMGIASPLTYSETIVDAYTTEFIDKFNGFVTNTGSRRISEDGQTMYLTINYQESEDEWLSYVLVYDKQ